MSVLLYKKAKSIYKILNEQGLIKKKRPLALQAIRNVLLNEWGLRSFDNKVVESKDPFVVAFEPHLAHGVTKLACCIIRDTKGYLTGKV